MLNSPASTDGGTANSVRVHQTEEHLTIICKANRLPDCVATYKGLSRLFLDADLDFLIGHLKKPARGNKLTEEQGEDLEQLGRLLHHLKEARNDA